MINSIELPVNIRLDGNIYRLVREFERGGAGRVFMAINDSSHAEVVIKLWSPRRLDRAMHDLRHQASSLTALQAMIHAPEIVSLTAEGRALILELVRGPSGREWLQAPRDFQVDVQRLIMIERTARRLFQQRIRIADAHANNWIFDERADGELTVIDPGGVKFKAKHKMRSPHQTIGTPHMQAGLLETIQHQYPALFLLYGTVSMAMEQGLSFPLMNERQFSLLLEGDHWFDFLLQPPLCDDDRILRRTLVRFLQRHPMADLFLKLHVDERLRTRITTSEADQALAICRTVAVQGLHSSAFCWKLATEHLLRRGLRPPAHMRLLTVPVVQQVVRFWSVFAPGRAFRR